jgi:hypothetical protein
LIGLDSASKPALSKEKLALSVAEWAEWVRNDIPQSTLDKAIGLFGNLRSKMNYENFA